MTEAPRILIVEARFYDELADALLEGAKETLKARGAAFDVVTVPGALEIPAVIAMAEEAGRFPTAPRYDGYVALGCVIRGETYHFEIVSDQSAAGITQLGLKGLAIGNGILTTEDETDAGGETLAETITIDSLPKPAADLASAVLREVGGIARNVDELASGLAKSVLGGAERPSMTLDDLTAGQHSPEHFGAAVYVALRSVLRRLGAPGVFVGFL